MFMGEQEIKDLFSDEAYVSSLLALDTAEEVQASLAEKGLDLSEAEITTLLESIQKYSESDGELSEADLENVSGGLLGAIVIIVWSVLMLSALGGVVNARTRRRW
jgi:hypothetical protein